MKVKIILLSLLLASSAWAQSPGGGSVNNGGSGGGGSTPITGGAGDFNTCTQTGSSLSCTVGNLSNADGSASLADSGLATPHPSNGVAGKFQLSDGSGNFLGVSLSQDVTCDTSAVCTVGGILGKSIPGLPSSASALTCSSGGGCTWSLFFPNMLSATGDLMLGGANVNTTPTRLADVAVGQVLHSGGVSANPAYSAIVTADLPANLAFSATNGVSGTAGANQPLGFEDAPPWMHYYCDGSETDPNPSGSVNVQGVHCYPTLTVSAGNTLNVTFTASSGATSTDKPNGAFIAYVQGACTIAGTITASGLTPNNIDGFGGSSGGAGGWGTAAGPPGQTNSVLPGGTSAAAIAAGGSAATSGNPGGNGNTPTTSGIRDVLQEAPAWSTCGGSPGGQGGSSGAAPGLGGGCVELICGSINFTGTINVSGTAGTAAGSSTVGAGGGGGGGIVLLAGRSVTNSGTITLTGGTGGAGFGSGSSTAGGNGGTGWSKVFGLM